MSEATVTTVHHLYVHPGDLLPACGITPGPDRNPCILDWHTGHDAITLQCIAFDGAVCCSLCLDLAEMRPGTVEGHHTDPEHQAHRKGTSHEDHDRPPAGGPCDLEHRGETADDVIKAQDRHLKEAEKAGDASHQEACEAMKGRRRHPKQSLGWYRDMRKAFADLPEG